MSVRDDMPQLPSDALCAEPHQTRVLRLEGFEPAIPVDPASRDAYERRFVTLFDDGLASRRGGLGEVKRVTNIWGEVLALKTLSLPKEPSIANGDAPADALEAAFRNEYRLQCRVSGLKGFPRVHGIAMLDGSPAILMEWIEGITLSKASRMLAVDDEGRMSPLNVARIGRDLFELLARLDVIDSGIVHGDISCGNVMVRTDRLPLSEQAEEGVFDLCLIDFGSARLADAPATSECGRFPTGSATIAYASPETIDPDAASRRSACATPASDVYAAASVLFKLATGLLPFDVSEDMDRQAAAQIKTQHAPAPFRTAHSANDIGAVLIHEPEVAVAVKLAQDDAPSDAVEAAQLALVQVDALLDPLLLACLSPESTYRPSAAAARDAMGSFAFHYADNVRKALRGEPLTPCVPGSLADGYGAAIRERTRAIRLAGKAFCAAAIAAVSIATGMLVAALPAAFVCPLDELTQGFSAGCVSAAAMAVPFAAALLVRWKDDGSSSSLVRGAAGLLAGILLAAACFIAMGPAGSDTVSLIVAGTIVVSCASCGWLLLDFALPKEDRSMSKGRSVFGAGPGLGSGEPIRRRLEGRVN